MTTTERLIRSLKNGEPLDNYSSPNGRSFRREDLRGVDLSNKVFRFCDFSGADLKRANLIGADLRGSCFFYAKLDPEQEALIRLGTYGRVNI